MKGCFTSDTRQTQEHSTWNRLLSFSLPCCTSPSEAGFTFTVQQKVKQVWMSRSAAASCSRNFFFFFFLSFVSITVREVPTPRLAVNCIKWRESERRWTGRYLFSTLMEISDRCERVHLCVQYCACYSTRELLNGSGHCWSHGRDNGPNNLDESGRGLSI